MLASAQGLRRVFDGPQGPVRVLDGVDLRVAAGSRLVIEGDSGAGKTTLLSILGLVDDGYSGRYELDGRDVSHATRRQRTGWRLRVVGNAFQDLHLVPSLTAQENVAVPGLAADRTPAEAGARAAALLEAAGLSARSGHLPAGLSGGERRRVAVARALVNRPRLLLLDEPTAGLDARSRAGVLALVEHAVVEGAAVVAAAHDPDWGAGWPRRVLRDGRLEPG